MSRLRSGILYILALIVILTACSAGTDTRQPEPLSTVDPIAAASNFEMVPQENRNAIGDFFSRWSAYTLALATGASDFGEVYTGLARFGDTWEQYVQMDGTEETILDMPLPSGNGQLRLHVQDGLVTQGNVAYDSADASVPSALSYMVACHALIYSIAWGDDGAGVQELYNECLQDMRENEDGLMRGTQVISGDYTFEITLDPDTQEMRFGALLMSAAEE